MLPMLAVTLRCRLRCNLINCIDSGGVKSRLLSSKRDAMGYISTDEKAGIKDRPQQRPNVQEDQHNFEDENGKIEERCVRVLLIKDENNERNNCTPTAGSASVSIV